jgi:Transcriptional regulator, AbiEi antitoxin, Type IV TA system/Transcriptional regulator, AbiEi antitoxin N-terminal domain
MAPSSTKSIEQCLPEGQLANRRWLQSQGFNRPRVDYFLRSGKIVPVARGIYRRPGPPLKWEHVVFSLNEIGYPVRVGGRAALNLQGLAHYLPVGKPQHIDLYGQQTKVPGWVVIFQDSFRFEVHTRKLFDALPAAAIHHMPFGAWDWPIPYSTPELAMIEFLAGVQDAAGFFTAEKFFESAVNLRPDMLRDLLLSSVQVKAKRLFLWFADRHEHAWREMLATEDIDLGRGKRMIVKSGAYDANYQITVPREMNVGNESPLL